MRWPMMIEAQKIAFGYDEAGNAPHLVAEADKEGLLHSVRVGGDAICETCGTEYRTHPAVQGALWATRACERIVKL